MDSLEITQLQRSDVESVFLGHVRGPHVIGEAPRPYGAPTLLGKRAAHVEGADRRVVARAYLDAGVVHPLTVVSVQKQPGPSDSKSGGACSRRGLVVDVAR